MDSVNGTGAEQVAHTAPQHIAIIMDGNGRWAKQKGKLRVEGHRAGAKNVRMVVEECRRAGVKHLTLYAFSTENWNRPQDEVSALMKLFKRYLRSELNELIKNGIRLRSMGEVDRLPDFVREPLVEAEEKSKDQTGMDLILAVSYGGRDEIVHSVKQIAEKIEKGELRSDQITQESIRSHLFLPDIPDPDLIIRTSNEIRISNFLIWQLAYSEFVFSPVYWPDFTKEEFYRCLDEFNTRVRRYGMTSEQLSEPSTQASLG